MNCDEQEQFMGRGTDPGEAGASSPSRRVFEQEHS